MSEIKQGRPTKYEPWMDEEFIKLRKQGKIVEQIAEMWDLSIETLRDWAHKNPNFSVAYSRGRECYKNWLYQKAIDNFDNPKFNERAYKFIANVVLGWSEKSADRYQEIPNFTGTIAERTDALNTAVKKGEITVEQHHKLNQTLNAEVERTDAREAAINTAETNRVLKELTNKRD
jgi:hypothetical protein